MRIFALFLFVVSCYADINGYVIDVPKSDTIVILQKGVNHRIRLMDIQIMDAYTQEAKNDIVTLCMHKKAYVREFHQDKLGRNVGIVFCDNVDINQKIIYNGFALTYRRDKKICQLYARCPIKQAWYVGAKRVT